jgi:hypothetical protein
MGSDDLGAALKMQNQKRSTAECQLMILIAEFHP